MSPRPAPDAKDRGSSVYGVLEGFGVDGGAVSERHCLMKALLVLPSDRYMAL
jgi:hypothetical protein